MSQANTLLDLHKTADAAALAAADKSQIEQHAAKPAAFTAAGHDPLDYQHWSNLFDQSLSRYQNYAATKTPSAIAAEVAAAKK